MNRYARRTRALAASLSALAGYIDVIGFLKLGGFFVSFMSGNSTRLAVGLGGRTHDALIAGGLIAVFVLGVVAGSFAGHFAHAHRRPVVLGLVTLLLTAAAGFGAFDIVPAAVALLALAMGAENAIFEKDGEVTIGLTYMTGTLVKLGQRLVAALLGGERFAWLPYLLQWLGLLAGAVAGALVYPHLGLGSLWIAAGVAAGLTLVAVWI